ncbi:MAG: hypothetical protein J0H54_04675, partial [Rhizobiales bacterium]|nr:hypothetical protein [Hyphomicrobiales bacterium]
SVGLLLRSNTIIAPSESKVIEFSNDRDIPVQIAAELSGECSTSLSVVNSDGSRSEIDGDWEDCSPLVAGLFSNGQSALDASVSPHSKSRK